MALFNNTFNTSSTQNSSSFGSGLFGQNNQNQAQSSLFGNSTLGNKTQGSTFGNSGGGGLFGNALQSVNTNSNNSLGSSQQNSGGLFGGMLGKENQGSGMGFNSSQGGLFGGQENKQNGGNPFFSSSSGLMGMMGGSSSSSTVGTVGYHYDASKLQKTSDGLFMHSVTTMRGYNGKSLDELRAEDYSAIKNNQIPEQRLAELQTQWKKNQDGGSGGMLGMLGGGNNNQSAFTQGGSNSGGGLFGNSGQNNNTGGGLFSSGNNNNSSGSGLFGGNKQTTGGLGMNNQSNTGNSLFGGMSGNQGQSGGLFGQSSTGNNNQSSGGLFGGSSSSSFGGNKTGLGGSSGLFGGSNNNNNTSNTSGGLFGNNNSNNSTANTSGGLFGGNNNSASNTSGGLFGGNKTNTANTSGGLFGNSGQNTTGGLMSQQKPQTGGLFGNSTGQQGLASNATGNTAGGSGLFQSGAKKEGGLFGNSNTTSQTGNTTNTATQGGLFSQGQGQAQGQGQGQATGNATTQGQGSSLFSSGAGASGQGGLFSGSSGGQGQQGGLFSGQGGSSLSGGAGLTGSAGNGGQGMQVPGMGSATNQITDMIGQYFGIFGESMSMHEKIRELERSEETENLFDSMKNKFPSYNPFDKSTDAVNSKSKRQYDHQKSSQADQKMMWGSKGKSSLLSFINPIDKQDEVDSSYMFKPQTTEIKRKIKVSAYEEKSLEKKRYTDYTRIYDSVSVYVVFQKENSEDKVYTFDVSLSSTCSEIKNNILKQVLNTDGLSSLQYKLIFKNKILKGQTLVKDIGLAHRERLYLIPDPEGFGTSQVSTISSETSRKLAPESLIPLLTNNNQTIPSMLKLSRMTEDELANVEDFVIYNENAKVMFPGKTDLRGMNLDDLVILGQRSVEVYPEDGSIQPPEVGKGLNKPAIIEFYKWAVPRKYHNNVAAYTAKLRKQSSSQNVQYRGYDPVQEMLVVSVTNFSSKNLM